MAFRFISSNGGVTDVVATNLATSGTVHSGDVVDFVRGGTGGAVVGPSGSSSTTTMVFGVGQEYAQGASDTFTRVIIFSPEQLWEVDCANAATTAQVGIRHALSAARGYVHNTASDVSTPTGIFLALGMTQASGSGKLIGRVYPYSASPISVTNTTFLQ